MRIETVAVHAGAHVDPGTGAVTPAIHPSTTFERDADGSYPRGFLYSRNSNPNRSALEECLAALEGGEAAAAFASASAARRVSSSIGRRSRAPARAPLRTSCGCRSASSIRTI